MLQVHHSTPPWAGRSSRHFPEDLRDLYRFLRQMAIRWKGRVQAFEPWNKADVDNFGGQTGSEMATLQKAGYLGIKAGNPDAIACLNVFAIARPDTLDDFAANAAWPYFDTCNLHHYIQPGDFPKWYAAFRRSLSRPALVGDRVQSARAVGRRREGPRAHGGGPASPGPARADPVRLIASRRHGRGVLFPFPHYIEGQIQFGIVHRDLTPRPAYLALAAVGRLLADARPLGRLNVSSQAVRAYLFRAGPTAGMRTFWWHGRPSRHGELPLPVAPAAIFDHIGRSVPPTGGTLRLSPGPVYAVLPPGTESRLTLDPPPARPQRQEAKPSPVVLQCVWPRDRVVLDKSAYRVTAGQDVAAAVFAYNFSESPVAGKLTVAAPNGWTVSIPDRVELAPRRAEAAGDPRASPVAKGGSPAENSA